MKIFISYGHNDHVKLVDKLFDTLIQAGHEPWKDDRYEGSSGINPGEEFTKVIYDAIDASDFVIAFVSQITQERPYCIGERNYSYNHKGNRFIQIRLDHTDIRLGNECSFIDMSDVEDMSGEINERMFQEQINKLFSAFRDPVSFAEGGFTPWAKFEKHLKVPGSLQYDEFITIPDIDDFVGRKWLTEKCKKWATDTSIPCRLFVIYGEAGTGKTAFVRHLAQDKRFVRSVHICIYDRPRTRTVEDTLKDLAYVLAKNNDTYFNFLKNKDLSTLDELGLDGLFEFLFLEPLKTESEKFLLVIDGLDELDEKKGFDPLVKLFRQHANRINPNISFLVTGRPDNNIISRMKTVGAGKAVESVNLDIETNNSDLNEYIENKLQQKGIYSDKLAKKFLDACDGNFEYLSLLFREIDEGLVVSEQMPLPEGLNSRYTQYIERRFENNGLDLRFSKLQRRLMSVLCAVYEPLPLTLLADILGEDEYDIEDEIHLFGSLIRQKRSSDGETMISLFTKGFRDYLLSKVCREFQADYRKGNTEIAEYILNNFKNEKDFLSKPYINNNGMAHILIFASECFDIAAEHINNLYNADSDAAVMRLSDALVRSENEAVLNFARMYETHRDIYSPVSAQLNRSRKRITLSQLQANLESLGYSRAALLIRYRLFMHDDSKENYIQAEEICKIMLEIDEQSVKDNPCYETRRELGGTYDRLGTIARKQTTVKTMSDAEKLYFKKLELDELNYNEKPCYESRRDLALTCNRLGDIAKAKNTPEELAKAEKWYKIQLECNEENFSEKPCYQSRRDVAVTCNRLGDIAKAKKTSEGFAEAEKWYCKGLEIYEQNLKDNPCYESKQDFLIICERLGDVSKAKNTPEGFAEAEKWYYKELELIEQNFKDNPCYESRRGLSITYGRLADIAKTKNTPEGLSEAQKWHYKELELSKQNFKDNPCYQSRRDLLITYLKIGDMAKLKNTPEGFAQAEMLYHKELELSEQNFKDNPCYQSRRDLLITYEKLGDMAKLKSTPEGFSEAEMWYNKEFELSDQNFRDNPCFESRRDLCRIFNKLGGISRAKNTLDGLYDAEMWYTNEIELYNQELREKPDFKIEIYLRNLQRRLLEIDKAKEEFID